MRVQSYGAFAKRNSNSVVNFTYGNDFTVTDELVGHYNFPLGLNVKNTAKYIYIYMNFFSILFFDTEVTVVRSEAFMRHRRNT